MSRHARSVAIVTHSDPEVSRAALAEALAVCRTQDVQIVAPEVEFEKHADALDGAQAQRMSPVGSPESDPELCLVLGGDGTMLRAFRLMRGRNAPVAGVNLGRVGFLTTVNRQEVSSGVDLLLSGSYEAYSFPGLQADADGECFQAANDVVVSKGDRATACSLGLAINGVTVFEVSCDGVVVATPAGSSAYSMAAGGPLVGISVEAYVISLVAAHAVGVRPVVAGPTDVLQITNTDHQDCYLDIDGQRMMRLSPGSVASVRTVSGMNSLALLPGDSLYHHFRDRLL